MLPVASVRVKRSFVADAGTCKSWVFSCGQQNALRGGSDAPPRCWRKAMCFPSSGHLRRRRGRQVPYRSRASFSGALNTTGCEFWGGTRGFCWAAGGSAAGACVSVTPTRGLAAAAARSSGARVSNVFLLGLHKSALSDPSLGTFLKACFYGVCSLGRETLPSWVLTRVRANIISRSTFPAAFPW